ncbi:hypothetical protein SNEBB_006060 [Seison nebaliae]|nr:hypothetical protein SNEBB_006060 [Seison nebaliae]
MPNAYSKFPSNNNLLIYNKHAVFDKLNLQPYLSPRTHLPPDLMRKSTDYEKQYGFVKEQSLDQHSLVPSNISSNYQSHDLYNVRNSRRNEYDSKKKDSQLKNVQAFHKPHGYKKRFDDIINKYNLPRKNIVTKIEDKARVDMYTYQKMQMEGNYFSRLEQSRRRKELERKYRLLNSKTKEKQTRRGKISSSDHQSSDEQIQKVFVDGRLTPMSPLIDADMLLQSIIQRQEREKSRKNQQKHREVKIGHLPSKGTKHSHEPDRRRNRADKVKHRPSHSRSLFGENIYLGKEVVLNRLSKLQRRIPSTIIHKYQKSLYGTHGTKTNSTLSPHRKMRKKKLIKLNLYSKHDNRYYRRTYDNRRNYYNTISQSLTTKHCQNDDFLINMDLDVIDDHKRYTISDFPKFENSISGHSSLIGMENDKTKMPEIKPIASKALPRKTKPSTKLEQLVNFFTKKCEENEQYQQQQQNHQLPLNHVGEQLKII